MENLGAILFIAIISFIAGYYSKGNKQVLEIKDTLLSAESTISEFSGNYDLRNESRFFEKEVRANKAKITSLKKELEEFNNEELETAKHTKWKKEKAEKQQILSVEKVERKKELLAERNGTATDKPEHLK